MLDEKVDAEDLQAAITETAEARDGIDELNKEFAVAWAGGEAILLREHYDPVVKRNTVSFAKIDAAKTMLANRFIAVVTKDEDGEDRKKKKPLFPHWLQSDRRRQYKAITFEPWPPGSAPPASPDYYNLFRGWELEADSRGEQGCQLFLRHLREVVCGDKPDHARWLLAWLAQAIQQPGLRPGTAVVLRQGQGAGKGMFVQYYGRIWGPHFLHLQNRDDLIGRFNAHLKDALLVFGDEISFGGDRKTSGVLKAIITEERVMIEPKFRDKLAVRNNLRLIMSTNERWSVPTDHDARRFFMPDVSDKRKGDRAYFDALDNEMNNSGPAALLHYLMNLDIGGIDLRTVPKTTELMQQKHLSLSSSERFWLEALGEGELNLDCRLQAGEEQPWTEGPLLVSKRAVYEAYCRFVRAANERYPDTQQIFWSRIRETCQGAAGERLIKPTSNKRNFQNLAKTDRFGEPQTYLDRVVKIPRLGACRTAFERWAKQPIPWDDETTDGPLPELEPETPF